jgi:lysyl-tRNA synthetase class 2
MLELYQAQADFRHMMALTEQMLEHLARELKGTTTVEFQGRPHDLKAPFRRVRYDELFRRANGCDILDERAVELRAQALGITAGPAAMGGRHWALATQIFDRTVEDELDGPVFVTHFPTPISPLSKCDPADPRFTERFELYLGRMELANAFSELNDPEEQERRFAEQVASKDPEAPGEVDIDYVQALEYGMPPTGGLGVGVDRLAMVLANQGSIRDVLLFPTLRPLRVEASETVAISESAVLVPKKVEPSES